MYSMESDDHIAHIKYINILRFQKFASLLFSLNKQDEILLNNIERFNVTFHSFISTLCDDKSKVLSENQAILMRSFEAYKLRNQKDKMMYNGNQLNSLSKLNASQVLDQENSSNENDELNSKKILNLMQKQKDMASQEIQEEQISHSLLTAELSETTQILKESTMRIRKSVLEQNMKLDNIEKHSTDNMKSLSEQRKMVCVKLRACLFNLFKL